jgi:hypothetical protein
MRSLVTQTLSAVIIAQQLYTSEKTASGALIESYMLDDRLFKTITMPLEPYHMDFNQQYAHIRKLTKLHSDTHNLKQGFVSKEADEPIYTCADRNPEGNPNGFAEFFPVYVASLTNTNKTSTYTLSKCFKTIDFVFEQINSTTFQVHVNTGHKTGLTCAESFLFANTEIFHVEVFAFSGAHTL